MNKRDERKAVEQAAQGAAEELARRLARQRALDTGVHQIVLDNRETMRIVALPELVVARGDTVVAVVSPYAERPDGAEMAAS